LSDGTNSTVFIARTAISRIDSLKNTKIDNTALSRLKTMIRSLVNLGNSKLLRDFPIEIVDIPIDNIEFKTSCSYYPDLKFSNMKSFVIETLEQARLLADSLCITAIRVLIDYCNIVVFARFDHGLEIKQKKLDDSNSSKTTSTHSVKNGDDSCII
jgi:hypothetical protein